MEFEPIGIIFKISDYKVYFTTLNGEVTVIENETGRIVTQWKLATNNKKAREALINLLTLLEQGGQKKKVQRKYRGYKA